MTKLLKRLALPALCAALALASVPACSDDDDDDDGPCVGVFFVGTGQLFGSECDDDIQGSSFGDSIDGQGGNDTLDGRGGSDFLDGDSGSDILEGGPGADMLEGGPDFDTASYVESFEAVTIDLANFSCCSGGDAAGDQYSSIESVSGSLFDDTISGDDNGNALNGDSGDDVIDARGGDDSVNGGDGNDRLTGGTGVDQIQCGPGDDLVLLYDPTDSLVDGGDGNDAIVMGTGTLVLGQLTSRLANLEGVDMLSAPGAMVTVNPSDVAAISFQFRTLVFEGDGLDTVTSSSPGTWTPTGPQAGFNGYEAVTTGGAVRIFVRTTVQQGGL